DATTVDGVARHERCQHSPERPRLDQRVEPATVPVTLVDEIAMPADDERAGVMRAGIGRSSLQRADVERLGGGRLTWRGRLVAAGNELAGLVVEERQVCAMDPCQRVMDPEQRLVRAPAD